MTTYVIERKLPGAGAMTKAELQAAAAKSCAVLSKLGNDIRWLHSYVTKDALVCIYEAKHEDLVRKHAQQSGFPADRILPVVNIISPATATGGTTGGATSH